MGLVVQKYGGTSVGSTDRIKEVAKRVISTTAQGHDVVVVVSAMGKTTNRLIELSKEITSSPEPREYDALVSTGENVSAALLAMALLENGQSAISLNGTQAGVQTGNLHSKAKIIDVNPDRIHNELRKGKVVVVTGFQGINDYHDITTIGRGGSDTSAVVLAAALQCSHCEIYTDVDGVYTTDPRRVADASKLPVISYDEMLELASLGAKVLHPRAVEIAKENNIDIHVKSSFNTEEGTIVKEIDHMEINRPVTGINLNENEALLSIEHIPDNPGTAGILFSSLEEKGINVDMIIQSTEKDGANTISFTTNKDDRIVAEEQTKMAAEKLGATNTRWNDDISKISIVGVGMISKPGIAAKMFRTLGDNGINILLISTSEIKVSCVIPQEDGQRALELLHREFELDKT